TQLNIAVDVKRSQVFRADFSAAAAANTLVPALFFFIPQSQNSPGHRPYRITVRIFTDLTGHASSNDDIARFFSQAASFEQLSRRHADRNFQIGRIGHAGSRHRYETGGLDTMLIYRAIQMDQAANADQH